MNAREQLQITDNLAALQARGDQFTRQFLQEKQRVSQYEAQLREYSEQITKVREQNKKKAIELLNKHTTTTKGAYQRVDGKDPTRLAEINQKKLVDNLESRLDKSLVRQNSIETENNVIKGKIDKLRRKVKNDSTNRKNIEKQLKQIKDDVSEIMKRAADVSEQRDKIVDLQNQLIKENMEERGKFNEEYMRLSAYIAEQNELLENSIAKVASDVAVKLEKADVMQPAQDESGESHLSPIEEMKALDAKLEGLEKQQKGYIETLEKAEEKDRLYEESFKKLRQVSGLTSTADIIKAFVDNEEESFSLFNYIQTINQECDRFLDERVKLENEMDEYKREQGEKEKKRKAIFDEYNNRLAGVREEKDRLHEANRDRKMTVLSIAKTVQGLYIRLKCRLLEKDLPGEEMSVNRSRERKLSMFAGEQISEQNILNHMTLIEKRAIQLIAAYANTLDESSSSNMKRHRSTLLVSMTEFLSRQILLPRLSLNSAI